MDWLKDWKLKLRYGKLKTAFRHFTVIADGMIAEANPEFGTTKGMAAFFTIHAWATDSDEASDMVVTIGRNVGFEATGEIHIYDTDPKEPPREIPYAYSLGFQQYPAKDEPLAEERGHPSLH